MLRRGRLEEFGRHTIVMPLVLAILTTAAPAQTLSVAAWDDRCRTPSPPMSGESSSGALRWRATRTGDGPGEFLLEGNARIAFAGYLVCADTIVFDGRELHARGNAQAFEPSGTRYWATNMKFGPPVAEAFKNALGSRSP